MRSWFLLGLLTIAAPLRADSPPDTGPLKPAIDSHYNGGFRDQFPDELSQVQTAFPLAQLDMATLLGLSEYAQGFRHPVTVRFDDGGPAVSENPFFYILFPPSGAPFQQTLMVNVEAFTRATEGAEQKSQLLRRALNYSMSALILNDMAGGDPDKDLPLWMHEGISVYVSGMGPAFVEKTAREVTKSHVDELIEGLNTIPPFVTFRWYARYFLAMDYFVHTGGSGSFQALIRYINNSPNAPAAIKDVLGQEWPEFERNVRVYSKNAFLKFALEDEDFKAPRKKT